MTSWPSFSSMLILARVRSTQALAPGERRRRAFLPRIEREVCVWLERGISGLAAGKRLENQWARGQSLLLHGRQGELTGSVSFAAAKSIRPRLILRQERAWAAGLK